MCFLSFQAIIREIVFPLMCYSKSDEELWNEDPHEYIKVKNGKDIAVQCKPA